MGTLFHLSACASSTPVKPDAGESDARAPMERIMLETREATCSPEYEAECGCVGGYGRCDTCDDRCVDHRDICGFNGICVRMTERIEHGCSFQEDESERPSYRFCQDGQQCQLSERDGPFIGPGVSFRGGCWPLDFCLSAEAEDDFASDLRCYFFDGTPADKAPTAAPEECPDANAWAPFCGGPCDDRLACPGAAGEPFSATKHAPCIGINADRAMGFCAGAYRLCKRGRHDWNEETLDFCRRGLEGECACVEIESSNPDQEGYGYVTLLSTCQRYAAIYPGQARCLDAAWETIEP